MAENIGRVIQITGPAVDVQFDESAMPPIYEALRVVSDGFQVPMPINVVLEVQQHLGEGRARCIAMSATEGNDLWLEMSESGVIKPGKPDESKAALIYGQMTEPPGARLRVALTGLTVAEYFRDEQGADTLLFIDNIFRFTQAGSEVSALLGRLPSAVGYQPNLATEMGELQERITSTKKGSITSVQAIYVPADDLTDPAP